MARDFTIYPNNINKPEEQYRFIPFLFSGNNVISIKNEKNYEVKVG